MTQAREHEARRNRERGSALLEFVLSIWTVFLVVFLIFEFCMSVYTYSVLANAAREGIRYAVVHGSDSGSCSGPGCSDAGGNNVSAVVKDYAALSFHDLRGMRVTPTWSDGKSSPGGRVKITVNYPYIPYLDVPGFTSPTMQVTAEGRIVF